MSGCAVLGDGKTFAYELGQTIGIGATGKVKLGVHKLTGERVAVKIVNARLFEEKPELMRKVLRECDIMGEVAHPHVVRFLGKYESASHLYLVLELVVGGELFDYLLKTGRQSEDQARKLFRQLISAVHYCHERNVCHRDIKPENLLLDEAGNMKVADFGYAQWMRSASDGTSGWVETSCGSPHYASPEVIQGDRYVGNQADVWSCGVVLFALLTGGLPFDDDNIQKLLQKVKRGVYQIPSWVPPDARDLIWRMLTVDPAQRITTAQIQQHPWFVGAAPSTAPAVDSTVAEATRQVGRFSLTGGAAAVPQPESEPAVAVAPVAEQPRGDDHYARLLDSDAQGAPGVQQLSPAQRQALERLQAAQAAAVAVLAAPAEDPVTHYLQQSSSRQELAIARHELQALRDLRSEMDPQAVQVVGGSHRSLGVSPPVDPRAEVARLEQTPGGTADELARVRGEVRLLQQELGLPLPAHAESGIPPPVGGELPPPPVVMAPPVAPEDGGAACSDGTSGVAQTEAPPDSLWARLGFA